MVSLAAERNLLAKEFGQTCLALPEVHGLTWALRVFAMAGFKPERFLEIAATADITIKKCLTVEQKLEIIRLATDTAANCKMLRAGYMWEHPTLGRGVLHRSGVYVDTTVAIFGKCGKVEVLGGQPSDHVLDKGWYAPKLTPVSLDPDQRQYIIKNRERSLFLEEKRVVGFWSNFMANPFRDKIEKF